MRLHLISRSLGRRAPALALAVLCAEVPLRAQQTVVVRPRPLAHLSALGGVFLLLIALNYRLKIYGLLFSEGRIFSGAGRTFELRNGESLHKAPKSASPRRNCTRALQSQVKSLSARRNSEISSNR